MGNGHEAFVGVCFGVGGTVSMSIALCFWKISNIKENGMHICRRKYLWLGTLFGVGFNSVLDTVAFSMAPLALIAPLQGLTIALTVLFARIGLAGPKESVSRAQWRGVALTIVGLSICTSTGPNNEAELELWPLHAHYFHPQWAVFYAMTLIGTLCVLITLSKPRLRRLLPPRNTTALSMILAAFAGALGGITQTQLKVLAHVFRAIAVTGWATHDTVESCANSYPGFCAHNITAGECCPGGYSAVGWLFCPAAGAFDVGCELLTRAFGFKLESWTIHWLVHWNGWSLLLLGPMQVKMASEAVGSNVSAVSVPLYSTAILFFTIFCGVVYFDDASHMRNIPLFAVGVLVVGAGLLVLARAKEQQGTPAAELDAAEGKEGDGTQLRSLDALEQATDVSAAVAAQDEPQAGSYDMRPLPEAEALATIHAGAMGPAAA